MELGFLSCFIYPNLARSSLHTGGGGGIYGQEVQPQGMVSSVLSVGYTGLWAMVAIYVKLVFINVFRNTFTSQLVCCFEMFICIMLALL